MTTADMISGIPDAPEGVIITTDPEAVPTVFVTPELRTPLRRSADGEPELVVLAQATNNDQDVILTVPDALGINGDSQIALKRRHRIMPAAQTAMANAQDKAKEEQCNLCVSHAERAAFRFNNMRPFGPLLHKLVASKNHIISCDTLDLPTIRDATEHLYEIGVQGRTAQHSLDGMTIGMNFGTYAMSGASQIHFHYQATGIGKANFNAGDRLHALCESHQQRYPGGDYLGEYYRALQTAGMVIAENAHASAYAPISPRFRGELQIMMNRPNAGNILDTTPEERSALSDLQHRVMQEFYRVGYMALNQVWYMSRFSVANQVKQRLVVSMCPRTSIMAFYELAGNSVIDELPWLIHKANRAMSA